MIRSYRFFVVRRNGPRVRRDHVQPGIVVQPEVAATDRGHVRVELDSVDPGLRVEDAHRPGRRAARIAEDRDPPQRTAEQRRNSEVGVPLPAGEDRVRPPERVHGEALVQVQPPDSVQLGDVDELVARLVLVDQARLRAHRAGRDRDQRPDARRDEEPAPAEQRRAGQSDEQRGREQRPPGSDRRDEHERGEEGAQEAARRGERVQAPGDRARVAHVLDREPHGEGRDHPEQHQRRREECEHREEGADRRSGRDPVEPLHGDVQERAGRERDDRDQDRREHDDPPEHPRARVAVRDLPADPVADRERREHEADDVRPDDRRAPVVGSEEARGADLGRQRGGSRAEHERVEREREASPLDGLRAVLSRADGLGHRYVLRMTTTA